MAVEHHEKTEPPSPKKLEDAKRKGLVARSHDMTVGFLLFASMAVVFFASGFLYQRLKWSFFAIFSHLNLVFDQPQTAISLFHMGMTHLTLLITPVLSSIFVLGVVICLLQGGVVFSAYPLVPRWRKLNIFDGSNYQKYFSFQTFLKFFVGQVQWIVAAVISWFIITDEMFHMFSLPKADPETIGLFIYQKFIMIGSATGFFFFLVSLIDLAYRKWKFMEDMKMTRRELKDEQRQIHGDIRVKGRMRSIMQRYVSSNLKVSLPLADLLIVDRNQLALALRYNPKSMLAPKCIVKGARKRAKTIIELSKKYRLPIVENSRLAQELYRNVDFGKSVPPAFYHEVADLLAKAALAKPKGSGFTAIPAIFSKRTPEWGDSG